MSLVSSSKDDFNAIKYPNGGSNDEWLPNFQTIYSSKDIYGIGTEDSQHPHVNVVQESNVQGVPNDRTNNVGHDNSGWIKINVVNHKEGQWGNCG